MTKSLVLRPSGDSAGTHFISVDGVSAAIKGQLATVEVLAGALLCGQGPAAGEATPDDPLCQLCLGRLRLLGPNGYRFELEDGREALISDWSRSSDGVNPGHRLPPYGAPAQPLPRRRPSALAEVSLSDPQSARLRRLPGPSSLGAILVRPALDDAGQPVALGTRCLVHYDNVVREAQARHECRLKVWTDDLGDIVGWPAEDASSLAALVDMADSHPIIREVYLVIESYRVPSPEEPDGMLTARFENSNDLLHCGLKSPPQPATSEWVRATGI